MITAQVWRDRHGQLSKALLWSRRSPEDAGAQRGSQVSEPSHSSLVFDVWDVPDGNQRAVRERSRAVCLFVSGLPGFLEANLYESVNGRRVLVMARFESVAERQRAFEDSEVAAALRDLRALAQPQMNTYELVEAFHPPGKKR
jgi:heme-degrading monooxygenase HmoA